VLNSRNYLDEVNQHICLIRFIFFLLIIIKLIINKLYYYLKHQINEFYFKIKDRKQEYFKVLNEGF
jgi:hypothetical protein